jgi:lysophospholipase L1-like esterase
MASYRVPLRRLRPALTATCTAAGAAALAWGGVMSTRLWRVRSVMRAAKPFSQRPPQPRERVVIAGDSTAVGAGSSHPRLSVAGRIGMALARAEVVNVARTGARLADIPRQLEGIDAERPVSLVIVLCGGEDVIRGSSRRDIGNAIDGIVARARELGARLILVPPGVVGRAPIWLQPLSSYYTWRARKVRRAIFDAARQHSEVEVIDLVPARSAYRFPRSRDLYAPDGLHPSDIGYGAWFERIVQQSVRLQARLTGPNKLRVVKSARTTKWSPHILRAAVR